MSSVIATATTASVNAMIRSDSRRDSSPALLASSSDSSLRFIVELVSSDSVIITRRAVSPRGYNLLALESSRIRQQSCEPRYA